MAVWGSSIIHTVAFPLIGLAFPSSGCVQIFRLGFFGIFSLLVTLASRRGSLSSDTICGCFCFLIIRGRLGTWIALFRGSSWGRRACTLAFGRLLLTISADKVSRSSRTQNSSTQSYATGLSTYASLSLRLLLGLRAAVSSAAGLVSSLLSSIARRISSSSSYAASRLFMVERRLGLEAESLPRDF